MGLRSSQRSLSHSRKERLAFKNHSFKFIIIIILFAFLTIMINKFMRRPQEISRMLHQHKVINILLILFFSSILAHAYDYRPRIFSKSFHYQLRQSEKQTLVGQYHVPPVILCFKSLFLTKREATLWMNNQADIGNIFAFNGRSPREHAGTCCGCFQSNEERRLEAVQGLHSSC